MRSILTTAADVTGAALLTSFAWFVWHPAALAVAGVAVLLASWQHASPPPRADHPGEDVL